MHRLILLMALLCCCFCVTAQQVKKAKAKLTEHSIVTDTAGNIVPADYWQQLIRNANYILYPVNPQEESSSFVIRMVTAKEKMDRMGKMPRPGETRSFRTGKPMGTFATRDINGNLFDIKELKGKVIVINFWFINCPPCRMEIPELNDMVAQYAGNNDVVFLAIALDAKWDLERFLNQMPFNYNVVPDGRELARKFSISAFPTHVVVNREGLVAFHTAGLAENTVYWIQKTVEQALAQPANESTVVLKP